MATKKQFDANRLNAQSSTGPRTEPGKAVSRMNALKHGIDALNQTISGENYNDLAAEYDREWQPLGLAERVLVDLLVRKDWLLRRYGFLSAQVTNYGLVIALKTTRPITACIATGSIPSAPTQSTSANWSNVRPTAVSTSPRCQPP